MSTLTDRDLLLHALQLNYVRAVLPNHAPLHAIASSAGPYNLVAFPPAHDLAAASPYLALSRTADPHRWPELAAGHAGRRSPPLALQLVARGADPAARDDAHVAPHRRRRGPGPLQYTQTIGKSVASAGIKVDGGRPRSGRSRAGVGGLHEPAERDGSVQELSTSALDRRDATEAEQYKDRLGGHDDPTNRFLPPPVVVHSPVKTPRDSPARARHFSTSPPRPGAPSALRAYANGSSRAAEPSGADFGQADSSAPSKPEAEERRPRFADNAAHVVGPSASLAFAHLEEQEGDSSVPASPASPSDFPPRPLESVATSSLESPTDISAASSAAVSPSTPADPPTPAGEVGGGGGGGGASLASSGISLYGAASSRRASSSFVRAAPIGDSDSDFSSSVRLAAAPSPLSPVHPAQPTPPPPPPADSPAAPDQDPAPAPAAPVFQLPPGLKVRERRRVNIRPGAFLAQFQAQQAQQAQAAQQQEQEQEQQAAVPAAPAPAPAPPPAAPPEPAPAGALQPAAAALPDSAPSPARRRSSRHASFASSQGDMTPAGPYFPPRSAYLSRPSPSPSASAPAAPPRSALSALLAAESSSHSSASASGGLSGLGSNPFSTLYQSCVSRAAADALSLRLFFPFCAQRRAPIELGVKRDVSVEEVIGAALWAYCEEGERRDPRGVDLLGEEGERGAREGRETARWDLRIVEDEDGDVDEDFPPLDRTRNLSAFAFTDFAIVRAEGEQVEDNLAKQSTIVRRPSRILRTGIPSAPLAAQPPQPDGRAAPRHSGLDPQTCAGGSALAIPVQLRVVVSPEMGGEGAAAPAVTEVQVPSDMYLVDVLDLVLRKTPSLSPSSARDWALVVRLSDGDVVVPLDRTVESLGEQHELVLVPRSQVGPGGVRRLGGGAGAGMDPSQSIFSPAGQGASQQPPYQSTSQLAAAPYLHFNVLRKLPMSLGGRHARVIAIDGDYLHFMPPEHNHPAAVAHGGLTQQHDPGSGRTTSFHISAVHSCRVSRRSASSFKIVVHTKRNIDKRYDFEAESAEQAREIVERVRDCMELYRGEQQEQHRLQRRR